MEVAALPVQVATVRSRSGPSVPAPASVAHRRCGPGRARRRLVPDGKRRRLRLPEDGEGPVRSVRVDPFRIAARAVSNRQFAEFVDATGYVTSAEHYGVSFVFAGLLPDDFPPTRGVVGAPWWREVPGACWRRPEGGAFDARRQGRPSGRPCVLGRRPRVLPMVGPAPADRGGVGVRRPRRSRRHALSVGQHAAARRRAPHERVAGRVSRPEHAGRRLPRHRPGRTRSRRTVSACTT